MTMAKASNSRDRKLQPTAWPVMEASGAGSSKSIVSRWLGQLVCRHAAHDWWALAYPPARRWECRRCGQIVEEAPTSMPDRRRVPRDKTKRVNGPDVG